MLDRGAPQASVQPEQGHQQRSEPTSAAPTQFDRGEGRAGDDVQVMPVGPCRASTRAWCRRRARRASEALPLRRTRRPGSRPARPWPRPRRRGMTHVCGSASFKWYAERWMTPATRRRSRDSERAATESRTRTAQDLRHRSGRDRRWMDGAPELIFEYPLHSRPEPKRSWIPFQPVLDVPEAALLQLIAEVQRELQGPRPPRGRRRPPPTAAIGPDRAATRSGPMTARLSPTGAAAPSLVASSGIRLPRLRSRPCPSRRR